MTKFLGKLTITTKPAKAKLTPIEHRRDKLLAKLNEQQLMAKCLLDGVEFVAYKFKNITEPETGERKKVKVQKRIRPWFYECNGEFYWEIKYGSRSLELAKTRAVITVGDEDKLPEILSIVEESVKAGELDTQLNEIKAVPKAKR